MRFFFTILGSLIAVVAGIRIYMIAFTDHGLVEHDIWYVWGHIFLVLVGLTLVYIVTPKKEKNGKEG